MNFLRFWWTYLQFRKWLNNSTLESFALDLLTFALHDSREHDFLDFKRDFFTERAYQKDKTNSEELTKDAIQYLLERYSVAFANSYGGFLIVGVAELNKGLKIQGINYKNLPRKKLLNFLKLEKERILKELKITINFISLTINKKEIYIFKIDKGSNPPYLNSKGRLLKRINDETIDIHSKVNNFKSS